MTLGLTLDSSYDQVAKALLAEMRRRNYSRDEAIGVVADGIQESGLRPRAHNPKGWDGIFQQDNSYSGRFDPNTQITGFLDRLDVKRKSPGHGDIWLNIFWLQQRPSEKSAADAYNDPTARRAYLTEIKSRTAEATRLVDLYFDNSAPEAAPMTDRPDFNEINEIGLENGSHSSVRSQLPRNWFLHTEEGSSNAVQLSAYLRSTSGSSAVSYHYTGSEDLKDHGVTIVDVVDTDRYAWAVLNANVFSINFCFAGSRAAQSRDVWLSNFRNVIRAAAYLAVQDAKKYPTIAAVVIPPPYANHGAGISDHKFVTQALGIGNHTDVGDNFPWDVFTADVQSFLAPATTGPNTPPPAVDTTPLFQYPTTDAMVREIWEQERGFQAKGWPQLDGLSQVDYLAKIGKKVGI